MQQGNTLSGIRFGGKAPKIPGSPSETACSPGRAGDSRSVAVLFVFFDAGLR